MSWWQGLRDRLLGGENPDSRAVVPREKPSKSLVQAIWESPALYNRRWRRAAGLYSRFWRWDLNAHPETRRENIVPRYIRRNFQKALPRTTRRQRKAMARIVRITRARGLM